MKRFLVTSMLLVMGLPSLLAAEPSSAVEGVITISPVHGGPSRPGVPDSRPLARTEFVVENSGSVVASFTTDDSGHFRVTLPPGHYSFSRKGAQPRVGRCGPFDVDLAPGQVAKVQWNCDSGMR